MKKRILSIALTVALLISLVPLAAISVNAASAFSASADMIEVLKKWEGFSRKPYWDYKQWTVGYGTRVPDGKLAEYQANGISEEEAEALLQEFLVNMGADLNAFADKFGLTWTQNQFDALLSLSFNCGTGWVYQPSTLRTAVVEGWTGDDFLFAFAQWSNSGNETLTGLVRRRLAEADMYLNGNYTVSPPEDYCYVLFNANGGETGIKVQGYDVNAAPAIRAVPTYGDFVFEGWYTDPTGGEKVTSLDATVKNYTLYAHWSAGNGAGAPQDEVQEITGTAVNYEKQVATGVLHSFQQPVKGALVLDAYQQGDVVRIVAEYTDSSNVKWGQISGGGWINLAYTQDFDAASDSEGPAVKVTVNANKVNLRRGPSTSYAVIGQVNSGDTLEITATANGSGYLWGKSDKGWIALKYTNYDALTNGGESSKDEGGTEEKPDTGSTDNGTSDEKPDTAEKPIATGKVKVQSGKLNVRQGPSTGYSVVGYLSKGDAVEIFETKTVGSTKWGRISNGWISMNYVVLDSQAAPETPKEEQKPEQDGGSDTGSGAVTGKIVLTSGRLNIRSGAGTNHSVVGWLSAGETVTITEQKTVNGTAWGKIAKGWICMNYVSLNTGAGNTTGGNSDSGSADSGSAAGKVTGVVSASGSKLRVRTGPGSTYSIAGYIADGTAVEILEQKTVNGTVWGRVSNGWVSMTYVKITGESTGNSTGSSSDSSSTQATVGTVTASCLLIRGGAGTNHNIVGRLFTGDKVTILETTTVNGVQWGRISNGWVCMDYIKL